MLKHRKAGGSAFGLALLAMLLFGAFAASAAQASPVWHKNGKTFKEAGISQVDAYTYGGNLKFEIPGWGLTINCDQNLGWGYLVGESSGTSQFKADSCSVEYLEDVCQVKPVSMALSHGLSTGGGTGVIETFTPIGENPVAKMVLSGEECVFSEMPFEFVYESGSLGAEVGAEGTKLPLTGIPSYEVVLGLGGEPVYMSLSGSVTQAEASGAKLGAW